MFPVASHAPPGRSGTTPTFASCSGATAAAQLVLDKSGDDDFERGRQDSF